MGDFRKWVAPLAVAAVSAALLVVSPSTASAAQALECSSRAPIFTTRTNGDLAVYGHDEPETGAPAWSGGDVEGTDWHGRTLAGADGAVYNITPEGALNLFRWDWAGGWENGGAVRQIGSGWEGFTTPARRDLITVDEQGRIFAVDGSGQLRTYRWDGEDWDDADGTVLDVEWSQYDLIVAAGDGVLFARTPNGDLFRFRYHADSRRWISYRVPVDRGWEVFDRVSSPGGDVLYGVDGEGDLVWNRYLEESGTWADSGAGRVVGTGWGDDVDTVAAPDACRLDGVPQPRRAAVRQDTWAPVAAVGVDGLMDYFYVDGSGRQVHAFQTDRDDLASVRFSAPVGADLTGPPSAVPTGSSFQVFTLGLDSAVRWTGGSGDTWSDPAALGGWMSGPVKFARGPSGAVRGFALDRDNRLWTTAQSEDGGPFTGWRDLGVTDIGPDFQVVPWDLAFEIVGRTRPVDGEVKVATFVTSLGPWRTLGGGTVRGLPSMVSGGNGYLQVFALRSDGTIATQRGTATGFPGVWQPIGTTHAEGAPAAVVDGQGIVRIAARGAGGSINVTRQMSPNSDAYREWTPLFDKGTSTPVVSRTDPSGDQTGIGGPVVFAFRDADENLRLYESTISTADSSEYTDVAVEQE
ncbi:tachylectin-related carbohydrate-binding protein [Umezawaea sp. Da 62-37]|uniref:tachylectin-related carbohydrate-binding protein n=1 Tax=Umezawaea sp. Da 62-37 TaxID=3075927 RepID=UPI0028F70F5C|nr:tachylectin-related carbohydrate-binding protein [Umezawaea sp. Da 62-37]WNV82276.1 tachylectin-related carbohydrate-binding protein [Umezawaea sp. Da 62-37]